MIVTSSTQLEHEAERTRAEFAHSLQELRSRLTVGQLAEEIWHQIRDGYGRDLAQGVARQVTHNPLPSALIGAGVVLMLYGSGNDAQSPRRVSPPNGHANRREPQHKSNKVVSNMTNQTSTIGDAAHDATSAVGNAASKAASAVGDAATSAYETVTDGAAQAASAVGEGASRVASVTMEGAQEVATRTSKTAHRLVDFCLENPLMLAGAGIALGAAIGAALPVTRTENKLMGEASDQVKRTVEHVAAEQLHNAEQVGERVADEVTNIAEHQFAKNATPKSTPQSPPVS